MEGQYLLLLLLAIIAFYTDIKKNIIPNKITFAASLTGILYHFITYGITGLIYSSLGFAVGFIIFLFLYLLGAVSAGDVKLFAAIGALTGTEFVLYSSMYSIIYAGVIGLLILLIKREFIQRILNVFNIIFNLILLRNLKEIKAFKNKENIRFPFMYAVLPGIITAYYYIVFI